MPAQVQQGDKVSWNWNGNHPSGVASEIKAGDVTVVSHRGNEITKTGTESDPAVHIERSGNDVVKTVSELNVEKKANHNGSSEEKEPEKKEPEQKEPEHKEPEKKEEEVTKSDGKKKAETNGDAALAGDKRKAEEKVDDTTEPEMAPGSFAPEESAPEAKKQKTETAAPTNGTKKGPGRPKGGAKKDKKVSRVGTSARKTRSQGTIADEAL